MSVKEPTRILPAPLYLPFINKETLNIRKMYLDALGEIVIEEIITKVERPHRNVIDEFRKFPATIIHEAMGKRGSMINEIKPIFEGAKITGLAITVFCQIGDNLRLHKALQIARSGDVLVVNAHGYTERGMLGEIIALAAKVKGIESIVIDGAVRDVAEIRKMKYPVYARAVSIGGTLKQTFGCINKPVFCGGVYVDAGDIVVGDDNGVVVVPKDETHKVLDEAEKNSGK